MSVTLAGKAVIPSIHLFNQKRVFRSRMQCLYCSVCHYMQPSVIIHKLVKLLTGDECTVSDCVLIEKLNATYRVSNN